MGHRGFTGKYLCQVQSEALNLSLPYPWVCSGYSTVGYSDRRLEDFCLKNKFKDLL